MANLKGQNGSFLVLFKDDTKNEIFMVFRTDYPIWVLPGGGIEPGETTKQAVVRETFEETGFITKIVGLVGKYEYPHKNSYIYEGRYVSGVFKPEYDGNVGKWFSVNHLP